MQGVRRPSHAIRGLHIHREGGEFGRHLGALQRVPFYGRMRYSLGSIGACGGTVFHVASAAAAREHLMR